MKHAQNLRSLWGNHLALALFVKKININKIHPFSGLSAGRLFQNAIQHLALKKTTIKHGPTSSHFYTPTTSIYYHWLYVYCYVFADRRMLKSLLTRRFFRSCVLMPQKKTTYHNAESRLMSDEPLHSNGKSSWENSGNRT